MRQNIDDNPDNKQIPCYICVMIRYTASVYGINNHIMHIIEPLSQGGLEGLKPFQPFPPLYYPPPPFGFENLTTVLHQRNDVKLLSTSGTEKAICNLHRPVGSYGDSKGVFQPSTYPPIWWHFLPYKRWKKLNIFGLPTHLFLST